MKVIFRVKILEENKSQVLLCSLNIKAMYMSLTWCFYSGNKKENQQMALILLTPKNLP